MIKIFIAGATGWVGTELSKRIIAENNLQLVGGLSRSRDGADLAEILQLNYDPIPLFDTMVGALDRVDFDVMIDFTKPEIAKDNVIAALSRGKRVVLGTSGLSDSDFKEIAKVADENNTAILAAGNFAITAVLLQRFAEIAAKFVPHFEVIDYASGDKPDAPSGTVAELAYRLSAVRKPDLAVAIEDTIGRKDARGAGINGIQVHSVRLPGHILGVEVIFGEKDEKLILRHDAGNGAEPYIKGILLAVDRLYTFTGLKRGLDTVMNI
ncbi:4-hydroxy-tetrahydrodipicolinate reductase [Sphingobacterium sp. HMA12]|uniref:4-hydroxy-tetrahydrodipicolinate reductase n=1 Tax=Sphingobacterium sp. HMA12 TaxID=2050894 RepID=UPI0018F85A30|nr:4-hydroxy-tetrahydrodipicolinate reductase [Sphingobacterium sp. HMA12]